MYRLEEAARPIARFVPHTVPTSAIKGFDEPMQWWPRQIARRRERAGAPGEGMDDAADEAEDLADVAPAGADGYVDDGEHSLDLGEVRVLMDADDHPRLLPPPPPSAPSGPSPPDSVPHVPLEAPRPTSAPRNRALRSAADVVVHFPGGFLASYLSKGPFQATCDMHRTQNCTSSVKVARAASSSGPSPWGRPVGLMAARLRMGLDFSDKSEHKHGHIDAFLKSNEFLALRQECRA
ncbi:hypothetical protein N9L68_08810 [bacterium]|nr:hypothetical protein [bacterium]